MQNPVTLLAIAAIAVVGVVWVVRNARARKSSAPGTMSLAARIEQCVISEAVTYISLGLIAYSLIAQVFVRSNGGILAGPLGAVMQYVSVFGPGASFSLFESVQVRSLTEMRNDGLKHGKGE